MKIEQRGVVITEVPGFSCITVQSDQNGQPAILLQPNANGSTERPWEFDIPELTAMRDALTEALKQAALMTGEEDSSSQVWNHGDPEPDHSTVVRDRDGDVWGWNEGFQSWTCGGAYMCWEELLEAYGSLAAVSKDDR